MRVQMRILAFSDLHGDFKALHRLARKADHADLLVCAGDFTVFENNILRVMKKLNGIGKPVVLVHGNHEDPEFVRETCKKMSNIHFVHKKLLQLREFHDYTFIGHGGGGFTKRDLEFERFAKKLRLQKNKKLIFITHQPPYKTKLDYIWAHHGNKSYREFVMRAKPVLYICGHLHETQGKEDRIGKTKVINPGPKGKIVEV